MKLRLPLILLLFALACFSTDFAAGLFTRNKDPDGGCRVRVDNEEAYFVFSNGAVVTEGAFGTDGDRCVRFGIKKTGTTQIAPRPG